MKADRPKLHAIARVERHGRAFVECSCHAVIELPVPERAEEDAAWFEGHHTDGVEAPKPKGTR